MIPPPPPSTTEKKEMAVERVKNRSHLSRERRKLLQKRAKRDSEKRAGYFFSPAFNSVSLNTFFSFSAGKDSEEFFLLLSAENRLSLLGKDRKPGRNSAGPI